MTSSSPILLPDNTQQSQQTNFHAPGGIRTHDLSRRTAADLRPRPRGHWDWRKTSTTNHISFVGQILEKKWEYKQTVHQLLIGFKTVCYSVRREVLCNIRIEFGILKELVTLIKLRLNEDYSRSRVGKFSPKCFALTL